MLRTVDEDGKLNSTIFSSGQNREMSFLTEDGVYEVLMQSRKPIAKQFKNKVKEILKEIRKTGSYATKPNDKLKIQDINSKTRMANMFLKLSNVDTLSTEYKNILVNKATEVLIGALLLPRENITIKWNL